MSHNMWLVVQTDYFVVLWVFARQMLRLCMVHRSMIQIEKRTMKCSTLCFHDERQNHEISSKLHLSPLVIRMQWWFERWWHLISLCRASYDMIYDRNANSNSIFVCFAFVIDSLHLWIMSLVVRLYDGRGRFQFALSICFIPDRRNGWIKRHRAKTNPGSWSIYFLYW